MKTNECPQCGAPVESLATRCGYCKVDFSIHHNERGKVAPITSKDINAAIDAEEEMEKERIRRREVEERERIEKAAEVERVKRIEKVAEVERVKRIEKESAQQQQGCVLIAAIIIMVIIVFVSW